MAHWLSKVTDILSAETSNLKELAQIAGEDPATFYIGIDPDDLELEGQDISGIRFSAVDDTVERAMNEFLSFILSRPRREERVAIMLKELFSVDPEAREYLMRAYPVQTVFEERALRQLNHYLPQIDDRDLQNVVYSIVSGLYTSLVSYDKGTFLLFLARWLGNVDVIRAFIKRKLRAAYSPRIQARSSEILRALTGDSESWRNAEAQSDKP